MSAPEINLESEKDYKKSRFFVFFALTFAGSVVFYQYATKMVDISIKT